MTFRPGKKREYVIVSVGGSLIVPESIDTGFLERFKTFILDGVRRNIHFFIIVGGGKIARRYQEAAKQVRGDLSREDLDWLGIHGTRMNAHLVRALFAETAQPRIVKNPTRGVRGKHAVIVGAGWKPGWSTDYCAVLAAKELGAKRIINLTDIDAVYDRDPKKDPTARPHAELSWEAFRALIPTEWDPGLSSPFDPVAAREAARLRLEIAIINGAHLDECAHYIAGEPFKGTRIK